MRNYIFSSKSNYARGLIILLLTSILPLNASPIYIVYHVAILNNWKDIVQEQLEMIKNEGLYDAADRFILCYVGEKEEELAILVQNIGDKIEIIHASYDVSVCEFPSIAKVKEISAEEPNANILYLHSKGLLHFGKPTEKAVTCWRRYMQYFLIQQWRICIDRLNSYDACGVEWRLRPPHFSGNFWWARASYINTLIPLPLPYSFRRRLSCEFFIGTGKHARFCVLHQSPFANLYQDSYTAENYRN